MLQATGLTPLEIQPVTQRLVRLQLLREDGSGLTEEGVALGGVLEHGLHHARRAVWFDAMGDHRTRMVALDEAAFADASEFEGIRLWPDTRSRKEQLHGHRQALERSKDFARNIRSRLWSDSEGLLRSPAGPSRLAYDWSVRLEVDDEDPSGLCWLPVSLPLHAPRAGSWLAPIEASRSRGSASAFLIELPVLEWSVTYAPAAGWSGGPALPAPVRLAASALDGGPVDPTETNVAAEEKALACRPPEQWALDDEVLIAGFERRTPPVEARWSRTTRLAKRWLRAGIDMRTLAGTVLQQHGQVLLDAPGLPPWRNA